MNKKKLMGAAIVAGSLAAFMVLVLPRYDAIQETRGMLVVREQEVAKKRKFVEKMMELKKQIEARQDDLDKMESFLSSGKKTQDVIVNLEAIAREAGVAIDTLKTSSPQGGNGENFEVLQVELDTAGQYPTLANLVKLIEKNLRIFDIQEISINQKDSGGFTVPLLLSLKINTYYLK